MSFDINRAIADGRFTVADDEWENESLQSDPKYLAYLIWNKNDVRLDHEKVEAIEELALGEDLGYGHHGQPMKVVVKFEDTHFVAIGEYDSWDGDFFPEGFVEAELVDVPTWLPKAVDSQG